MQRRHGLPVVLRGVDPGCYYPVDWPLPVAFSGRGRWRGGPLHLFVDDYRQEFFWRRPEEGLLVASAAGVVTAPDFTAWVDDPWPWGLYQGWRSALVAGYWQAAGVRVLPVVSFGTDAFVHVRAGSTWAIRGPVGGREQPWLDRLQDFHQCANIGRLAVFGRVPEGIEALGVEIVSRRLQLSGRAV